MTNSIPKVILLIETSRAFGRGVLYGIAKYSRLHGPWAFYREPRGLHTQVPRLKSWNADGIIMRNSVINNQLFSMKLPTIMVIHDPNRPAHIPAMVTDSRNISRLAAEHLLDRGFTNFAFCGYTGYHWSDERGKYFNDFVFSAGHKTYIYDQPKSRKYKSWHNEQQRMAEWLKNLPKPLGVMASNDDRGQHVLEACKIARLKVPEEVAVIGVDNDAMICDLCDPPLTSVVLDTEQAGFAAAELLDRLMKGEKMAGQEILVEPSHVFKRHSTDIMAIEDSELVKALYFVRNNAKYNIHVADVVKVTSLSRRSLETRFKNVLNRTIQEEIRGTRVRLIEQMLIETDKSVSEIMNNFDFSDVEHIARYFKKEKGVGLRDFRKIHKGS